MNRLDVIITKLKERFRNIAQLGTFTDFRKWRAGYFALPAPTEIKLATLVRYGGKSRYWVESGTYLGDTTKELSKFAEEVHTIEPSKDLFRRGSVRIGDLPNVFRYNDLSENVIGSIVDGIISRKNDLSFAFFLDGHYSHHDTFQGPIDTPILQELAEISKRIHSMDEVVVLVDDVRLFTGLLESHEEYPELLSLVSWAEENRLRWTIENDIFVALKS